MAEIKFDGENLQVRIIANEDSKAAPTTTDTIAPKKRIPRKRRVNIVLTQLSFLHAGDLDIVLV